MVRNQPFYIIKRLRCSFCNFSGETKTQFTSRSNCFDYVTSPGIRGDMTCPNCRSRLEIVEQWKMYKEEKC